MREELRIEPNLHSFAKDVEGLGSLTGTGGSSVGAGIQARVKGVSNRTAQIRLKNIILPRKIEKSILF